MASRTLSAQRDQPDVGVPSFLSHARLVVPFPSGGSTAHTAEVLATELEAEFGRRPTLDYQIGDYGLNALRSLVHAHDEHVLMIGNIITASMTPVMRRERMDFDFGSEVTPVTKLAEFPSILMVNRSTPVEDVAGLLQFCQRRDRVLRYGSDFLGTFVDVDAIEMGRRAGLSVALHEAGSAHGVVSALLEGKIDMALMNVAIEHLIISKNGSFTAYFLLPPSTQCSNICGTPVSSGGGVGNVTEKRFSPSSL